MSCDVVKPLGPAVYNNYGHIFCEPLLDIQFFSSEYKRLITTQFCQTLEVLEVLGVLGVLEVLEISEYISLEDS